MGDLNLEVERLEDRAEAAEAELERSRAAVAAAVAEQLRHVQVMRHVSTGAMHLLAPRICSLCAVSRIAVRD